MGQRGKTGEHLQGRFGANSNGWRGGHATLTSYGYVYIYVGHDHPMADSKGRAVEHRVIMSEHLGRALSQHELVHHLNGDKTDNRIDNLGLTTRAEHPSLHYTWHHAEVSCDGCGKKFVPKRKPRRERSCCSRECGVRIARKHRHQVLVEPSSSR